MSITREQVEARLAQRGLQLDANVVDELTEVLPHVEVMLARLDRNHGFDVEPAAVFLADPPASEAE